MPWVELYETLLEYSGPDAGADVLDPWPARNPGECQWLADFAARPASSPVAAADEDLCRLYAASRVTTLLLLPFQPGRADATDYAGPPVTAAAFRRFHEAVGFRVPAAPVAFHPFFHEVVALEPATGPGGPAAVVGQAWPPLVLGEMMYCRAGCVVAGGPEAVVPGVADRSTLFWAFRRRHRPCRDLSHGWGHNSQWRTPFRRDYRTATGYRYNVDGRTRLTADAAPIDGVEAGTWIEVVRHRCRVTATADDNDLFPYEFTFDEAIGSATP